MKKMVKTVDTANPAYKVEIRKVRRCGDKITMYAHGIDTTSEYVSARRQVTCHDKPTSVRCSERILISQIVKDLDRQKYPDNIKGDHKNEHKMQDDEDKIYTWAYDHLSDEDKEKLGDPDWSQSTRRNTLSYYRHKVLPRMDVYGADICVDDLRHIIADLVGVALKNGRSRRNKNLATHSVMSYIGRCQQVYRDMARYYDKLPQNLIFPAVSSKVKYCQPEQAKSIPRRTRRALARRLADDISDDTVGGLAIAAAWMYMCGLRTAEAAAPTHGEVRTSDTYIAYLVASQVQDDGNGKNIQLKTCSAYRYIVGPELMHWLLGRRVQILLDRGHTLDDICLYPTTSSYDYPERYPAPGKVSAYAKRILLESGYTADALEAAAELQLREPDLDADGRPERDVVAYILRRDWCTRAANVCGMDPIDVDYLMGHQNPGTVGRDYTLETTQRKLAVQLERCVIDPMHSRHTAYCPYHIVGDTTGLDLSGSCQYVIVNNSDKNVKIKADIRSTEPGEDIHILTPGGCTKADVVRGPVDTSDQRAARYIMLPPLEEESSKSDVER